MADTIGGRDLRDVSIMAVFRLFTSDAMGAVGDGITTTTTVVYAFVIMCVGERTTTITVTGGVGVVLFTALVFFVVVLSWVLGGFGGYLLFFPQRFVLYGTWFITGFCGFLLCQFVCQRTIFSNGFCFVFLFTNNVGALDVKRFL